MVRAAPHQIKLPRLPPHHDDVIHGSIQRLVALFGHSLFAAVRLLFFVSMVVAVFYSGASGQDKMVQEQILRFIDGRSGALSQLRWRDAADLGSDQHEDVLWPTCYSDKCLAACARPLHRH